MGALTRPRASIIDAAIELGRLWCDGHAIDGSPALGHALKVARKVDEHLPEPSPDLIAAVIIHDAPFFAPKDRDLDVVLIAMLNSTVARIVRAIEAEHQALDHNATPTVETTDPDVLIASAADKVVSIGAILRRAHHASDRHAFWSTRATFISRVRYFRAFANAAAPHLPHGLAKELNQVTALAAEVTGPYRGSASLAPDLRVAMGAR